MEENKPLSNAQESTSKSKENLSPKGASKIVQNFKNFALNVKSFLKLEDENIILYEKAKHNEQLCGFLLKRCNCAIAALKDLEIRKTENVEFFSN